MFLLFFPLSCIFTHETWIISDYNMFVQEEENENVLSWGPMSLQVLP